MREIVLDTETTGFDPDTGDRIVEIGAIELMNYLPTGRHFHVYINPERDMPAEALAVHGLTSEFLADKPKFAEISRDFIDFVGQARLVIHNAPFDMKFLNWELRRAGHAARQHRFRERTQVGLRRRRRVIQRLVYQPLQMRREGDDQRQRDAQDQVGLAPEQRPGIGEQPREGQRHDSGSASACVASRSRAAT